MDRVDSIDGSGRFELIDASGSVRPSVRPSVIDRSIGTIDRSIYRYD